jgi:signal transduction histidine kinase
MVMWAGQGWPGWWQRARSTVILAALIAAVWSAAPGNRRLAEIPLLVGCSAGWVGSTLVPRYPLERQVVALVALGGFGVAIAVQHPNGPALSFPAVACVNAGTRLPVRWSAGLTGVLLASFLAAAIAVHRGGTYLLIGTGILLVSLMFGLIRRQNDRLALETQLARDEQARSAALAERARLAREIHDVLAHSLAALTVQLETADALLEGGRAEQARESVVRAGQLAREGLAETRRAIGALRGETVPLPELLAGLAAGYRADLGAPARVEVTGDAHPLGADTSLALYRTAQEAMTNVRKHAPGAPVSMALDYQPDSVDLRVENGPAPDGAVRPLAGSGGGYGLTGLRERAELAGGEFTAGPSGAGWRVDVRIPLSAAGDARSAGVAATRPERGAGERGA